MPATPSNVADLRALLAARFPTKIRKVVGCVATGVQGIDHALGGGLPIGRLTELVSTAPGTGGQTILVQLLRTTRAARQRIALIDGADGFVPAELPPDALQHLVWIRAHDVAEVFAAADVVTRDGNYAVVVLDLRGLPERALLKAPASLWHRLRCAVDDSPTAVLVQTALPLVPAVTWRLNLTVALALTQRRTERTTLANSLQIEVARGHIEIEEKSA